MPKNALVVAGPKLQKALKDLAGGVKNIDLSTEKAPPKPQQILVRTVKTAAYDGMFAVQFDGKTLSVVDGGDPNSGTAGWYYMNGNSRHIKKTTGIALKAGWLCLKDYRVNTTGEFEIIDTIPNKPETAGKADYHPIALITKSGDAWSVRQISKWQIPQLWTFEDCDSEE